MNGPDLFDGLDFNNHGILDNDIRSKPLIEDQSVVANGDGLLTLDK